MKISVELMALSITNGSAAKNEPQATVSIETAIEHAKRAFALRKYEQAIDHYATALELMYVTLIGYFWLIGRALT